MFSTLHPEWNDDALLMRRLAAGDEEAFNRLFERHRGKLYDYLVKVTRSAEISEEIVTDVFVKLWIGKELVPEIRQLDAFLHTVAYHKALDFLRTVSRKRGMHTAYLDSFQPEPEKGADELLIDAESLQLFKRAVQTLPPKRKLIYDEPRKRPHARGDRPDLEPLAQYRQKLHCHRHPRDRRVPSRASRWQSRPGRAVPALLSTPSVMVFPFPR